MNTPRSRIRSTTAPRRRRGPSLVAVAVLALGACRADSATSPTDTTDPICYDAPCAEPSRPALGAAIVIQPLEDVVLRIVPTVQDARARAELADVLGLLRRELLAGRHATARVQLAYAYDWVERGGDRLNIAELSAIRLALVPSSLALGVGLR